MTSQHWIRAGLRSETIEQRYRSVGGFTHGFDYLRLILAVAVVAHHAVVTSGGPAAENLWVGWNRVYLAPILLMFFALSGFLVAGSLKRKPQIAAFVTMRAVRLLPALTVEVLLSALVIGPLMTELPWAEYFSGKSFFTYFLNIAGYVHYHLPGVFLDNPYARIVNISLWTVPLELECYLLLILLWWTGILNHRWWVLSILVVGVLASTAVEFFSFNEIHATGRPLPRALIAAFFSGICLNLFAEKIRLDIRWALLAVVGMVLATLQYQTAYIAAVFAAFLVVYFGMMHPPKTGFLFRGDYSYGLYLFAFPIQQTYTQLFPDYRVWYLNAAFTLVAGFAHAAFSWWLIEKPVLSRKKEIVAWVSRRTQGRKQWGAG